jgi:hypothetical protein
MSHSAMAPVRLTLAVSSRGERMRASGLLDCVVMRFVKAAHQRLDIGRYLASAHDGGPEVKGRCRDERIRESNCRQVVMEMRPPAAVERIT